MSDKELLGDPLEDIGEGIAKIQLKKWKGIVQPSKVKPSVLDDTLDRNLLSRWPKLIEKVPAIFIHNTVPFAKHAKKLLTLGLKFFHPYFGSNFTKIVCVTYDDHKGVVRYFEKNKLPFHTFGLPEKRKMRVVIRGLPEDTDLNVLKKELKALSVPVIRVHDMHVSEYAKRRDSLILAVVPYDNKGIQILRVKRLLGHDVSVEPPIPKTRQCHRCQKWGHSQRYCHGDIKCVKCAGDHFSKKCMRDREAEPPTCANCGGNHTANYKECFFCPDSAEYKKNQKNKMNSIVKLPQAKPRELLTLDNFELVLEQKKEFMAKKVDGSEKRKNKKVKAKK